MLFPTAQMLHWFHNTADSNWKMAWPPGNRGPLFAYFLSIFSFTFKASVGTFGACGVATAALVGAFAAGVAGAKAVTAEALLTTHWTPAQVCPEAAVQVHDSCTLPVAPPATGPTTFDQEPYCAGVDPEAGR